VLQSWGMAGWQPQGWGAAYRLTGSEDMAAFAFEAADWAVERQLEKNGAFLEDLSPTEPSFNTGFVAEGIAAAWQLAREVKDATREDRYELAWRRAMTFMRVLAVREEDTFCFARGAEAIGGVRTSITRSDIRIDAVSHTLHALVAGVNLL
jgi:hypothetical protein